MGRVKTIFTRPRVLKIFIESIKILRRCQLMMTRSKSEESDPGASRRIPIPLSLLSFIPFVTKGGCRNTSGDHFHSQCLTKLSYSIFILFKFTVLLVGPIFCIGKIVVKGIDVG